MDNFISRRTHGCQFPLVDFLMRSLQPTWLPFVKPNSITVAKPATLLRSFGIDGFYSLLMVREYGNKFQSRYASTRSRLIVNFFFRSSLQSNHFYPRS